MITEIKRQLYGDATRRYGQYVFCVARVEQDDYKIAIFDEDVVGDPQHLVTISGCSSTPAAFKIANRWLYKQQEHAAWRVRRDIRLGKYA